MSAYPHESEARPLQELHEARGLLLRVFEAHGQCVTVWAWGCCSFPAEMAGKLGGLVGKPVGILRLDGHYHARVLEDEHAA
jgi:hypothetical protein